MNFQGRLNDSTGAPMPNGTYNMEFNIYSSATGGTALWSESHLVSAGNGVTVTTGGLFSVQLGSVTSLPPAIFNSATPLYLEVELPSPATATSSSPSWTEGPMTPRNPIESSPYAINSDYLDGQQASSFATASGSANYLQNTTTPQNASFDVTGSGTIAGAFTATGSAIFADSTNSTTAFQVQNASGATILNVNSTTGTTTLTGGSASSLAPSGTNLTPDNNFADSNWSTTGGTWTLGGSSAALTAANALGEVSLNTNQFSTVAGTSYQVSFTLSNVTGPEEVQIRIGGIYSVGSYDANGTYSTVVTPTASNATPALSVFAREYATGSTFTIANISVMAVTSTSNATPTLVLGAAGDTTPIQLTTASGGAGNTGFALGYSAGATNLGDSLALGSYSLQNNTTGNENVGVGAYTLQANTAGAGNTATGNDALQYNTIGVDNVANGYQALQANTTGQGNTAVGESALTQNTTGQFNSTNGYQSLFFNSTGDENAASGKVALYYNTTGSNNTAFGSYAGFTNRTGNNNTYLGAYAGDIDADGFFLTGSTIQNATAIGSFAQVQESNSIVLGSVDNPTNVGIGTTVPTNTLSVSPVDLHSTTITASQTNGSSTITASAAIFSTSNIGEYLIWQAGQEEQITSYISPTQVTGSSSTIGLSATHFRTQHVGLQVTNVGTVFTQGSSTTQFQVQNTSGAGVLTTDTVNGLVSVGSTAANTNATLFTLNNYSGTTDPTNGVNGAMYYNSSMNEFRCYTNGAWTNCGGSGGSNGALTVGTLDSGTANSNGASISGNTLSLQSASATNPGLVNTTTQSFAGNKTFTGNTIIATSSTTAFQIQNAAGATELNVDTTTNTITLGSAASGDYLTFTPTGGLVASGTAQHQKTIVLTPEYAGAVLDATSDASCVSANDGTMTSGYDSTANTNYYQWISTSASAQCYDVVVQVPIPSDFSSWMGTPNIEVEDNGTGTGAYAIQIIPSSGSDADYGSYVSPSTLGTSWGNMATAALNGTYTPGSTMTIKIRLSSTSGAVVRLGNITLTYNSAF